MIVGHEKNIKYLKNLADNKSLFHSYIFFGRKWIGKKTIALSLANYLENNKFDKTDKVLSDTLFIDANKIKNDGTNEQTILDEIRNIKNFLSQKPNLSNYRIVIIDNAEHLTIYSQNALLKISEEPQYNSLIILICVDPEMLIPTINSRFQKLYFENIKKEDVKNWLIKEFKISISKADKISNLSNGFPGIAYLLLNNESFNKYFENAQILLSLPKKDKVDFIKKMFQNNNINFEIDLFLDALMFVLNNNKNLKNNLNLFKKIIRLKMNLFYYNLNPRLQLTALFN